MILRKRPVTRAATRLIASLSTGLLPLLYTTACYAIVIQPVQVKSSLGEPFYAEIAISDLGNTNLKDIAVDIANPQVLADLGIAAGSYNQPLSLNVQAQSADRGVIVIRSRQPINDPFVEFVIQVKNGQNTRLQRVNAMIDPPVTKKKTINLAPALTTKNSTVALSVAVVPPINLPVSSMPVLPASTQETLANRAEKNLNVIKNAPPEMQAKSSSEMSSTEPAVKTTPATASKPVERIASDAKTPKHMVKKNESLWKIAKQLEPHLNQPVGRIMQRIRDLNKDAFIAGNPNQLRRGVVLVLPENEQQVALAATPRAALPAKPVTKPAVIQSPAQVTRNGILPKAELTLVAPTGQGSTQGSGNSAKNAQLPSLPREIVLKIGQERRKTVLLQHEVSELDAQLILNDKKIAMLNAKLAELENQLKSRSQVQKPAALKQSTKPPIAKPTLPKVAANAFLPVIALTSAGLLASMPNMAYAAEGDAGGFPLWIIGAVVVVIIAVVAKVMTGKNSSQKSARGKPKRPVARKEQPASKPATPAPAQPVPVARPAAQPAQTDVLQEVQSYIERERYSQAQGLLKDAIDKNSRRSDLHIKLLEVYALQNDIKGFENQFIVVKNLNQPELTEHAEKMRVLLQPEPEQQLAEDLSLEFTPSNLPKPEPADSNEIEFQPSTTAPMEVEVPSSVADQSLADLEAEFGFSSQPSSPASRTETPANSSLIDHTATLNDAEESMLDLDFDLKDSFTLEEVKVPAQAPATFELDKAADSVAEVPVKPQVNLDQLNVEDTNWADGFADQEFSVGTDTTATHAASVVTNPTIPADLNGNAQDFLSKEFPFLVNLDVQQTNLELAESYINLGERGSARELLGEVIDQGNPQQKAQAQHLMQKLVS